MRPKESEYQISLPEKNLRLDEALWQVNLFKVRISALLEESDFISAQNLKKFLQTLPSDFQDSLALIEKYHFTAECQTTIGEIERGSFSLMRNPSLARKVRMAQWLLKEDSEIASQEINRQCQATEILVHACWSRRVSGVFKEITNPRPSEPSTLPMLQDLVGLLAPWGALKAKTIPWGISKTKIDKGINERKVAQVALILTQETDLESKAVTLLTDPTVSVLEKIATIEQALQAKMKKFPSGTPVSPEIHSLEQGIAWLRQKL